MDLVVTAREQAGLFSLRQARLAGWTRARLAALERRGLLVRDRATPRVYATAAAPSRPDPLRRAWAAVLAAGAPCVLTGLAAAHVHGFPHAPAPKAIRLLVPQARRKPRIPGVLVTRTRCDLRGARTVAGLPVTSVAITLRDLAVEVSPETLDTLVRDELRRRTVTLAQLRRACGRGRAGAAALRASLARCGDGAESRAERALVRELRRRGVRPRTQHRVGRYRLDLAWPDVGLGVEVEGPLHLDPAQAAYDARRANRLLAEHGVSLLRFPADAVLRDPAGTAAEVERAVTCRRRRRRRTSSP